MVLLERKGKKLKKKKETKKRFAIYNAINCYTSKMAL